MLQRLELIQKIFGKPQAPKKEINGDDDFGHFEDSTSPNVIFRYKIGLINSFDFPKIEDKISKMPVKEEELYEWSNEEISDSVDYFEEKINPNDPLFDIPQNSEIFPHEKPEFDDLDGFGFHLEANDQQYFKRLEDEEENKIKKEESPFEMDQDFMGSVYEDRFDSTINRFQEWKFPRRSGVCAKKKKIDTIIEHIKRTGRLPTIGKTSSLTVYGILRILLEIGLLNRTWEGFIMKYIWSGQIVFKNFMNEIDIWVNWNDRQSLNITKIALFVLQRIYLNWTNKKFDSSCISNIVAAILKELGIQFEFELLRAKTTSAMHFLWATGLIRRETTEIEGKQVWTTFEFSNSLAPFRNI